MTARSAARVTAALAVGAAVVLTGSVAHADGTPTHRSSELESAMSSTTRLQAERQSAALSAEDQRLLTLVASVRPGSGPYVQSLDGVDTLVLTAGGAGYGLADLMALGAAQALPDGSVLLAQHVFVAPGAKLTIDAPGTTLRLASAGAGFVSLVAWKAELDLAGTAAKPLEVTSWDAGRKKADDSTVDGRAYIRDVSGQMSVQNVRVSHLGFWSGRTSGVAWTGSSSTPATGSIGNSTFIDNHYGAFASQGEDLAVTGSTFDDNAVDGLSLHRSTAKTTITDSYAMGNGRHGFSADQGSESVTFTGVTAASNADYGIFFSGAPLATAQSASGASLRAYGELEVTGGHVDDNGKAGLRVVDGSQVTVTGTHFRSNLDGIDLAGTTAPTKISDTVMTGDQRFGVTLTDGSATVTGNQVTGAATGVRVRNAVADVRANTLQTTAHGISVVGTSSGTELRSNTVRGSGPSALDTYRLADGASVDTVANRVDGWDVDRDNSTYWREFVPNHPMLLLWVFVLGVPLVLAVRGRRRRVAPGTAPYGDSIKRQWAAPLRVHAGHRLGHGRHVAPGGQA